MATVASSSLFTRLVKAWATLALRSDVDDIILNILARFSLEKLYSEGEAAKETHQHVVITLLAQLNTIFYIQRMSLPNDNLPPEWYLNFLASWEVVIRTVEFVLQAVEDGRDALFEAPLLIEKYLAEMLLSALRILTLHPKPTNSHSSKDRRERFARIHRSLERVCDCYPGPHSFLLLVCREVTDSLRMDSNALRMPESLRKGLPNLASELYPLPDCVSPQSISRITENSGFGGNWLSQFLALRDVSQFVVGASIQYVDKQPRNMRLQLQTTSAKTRAAIYDALENMRLPSGLSKEHAFDSFSNTYRTILPDAGTQTPAESQNDECEMDAIDALCRKLNERQIIHRASDRSMLLYISEMTRNMSLLDDQIGPLRAEQVKLFAVNCPSHHLIGQSQLQFIENLELPTDSAEECETALPSKCVCFRCGKRITTIRPTSLGRHSRERMPTPDFNSDAINLERHQPGQFLLSPPKSESALPTSSNFGVSGHDHQAQYTKSGYQLAGPVSKGMESAAQPRITSPTIPNPASARRSPDMVDSSQSILFPTTSLYPNGRAYNDTEAQTQENARRLSNTTTDGLYSTSAAMGVPLRQSQTNRTGSNVSSDNVPIQRSSTLSSPVPSEKRSKWISRLGGSKREPVPTVIETSSLSSTTLDSQRLEEVSLKNLVEVSKRIGGRGKNAKQINVVLSQNSSYALFWTSSSIQVWDVANSPPTYVREERTESTCLVAAVTKVYLAYVIGTRDQKLTLRIVNLDDESARSVEYRMSAAVFSTCMGICPKEDFVVLGFENSTVRFFRTTPSEPPHEVRVHDQHQSSYKVETISFSNDGHILLCSTRSARSGMIHVFSWRWPFASFQEVSSCHYTVSLRESEDNGVSSAIFRTGRTADEHLICITTWTQSGAPLLVHPESGYRSEIRQDTSSRQGKLGTRIRSAAFSPSGRVLAMVNDKGQLFTISHLNSNHMHIRLVSSSKELKVKADPFALSFMTLPDEEAIVLAWTDPSKGIGYVKKIPVAASEDANHPETPGVLWVAPQELPGESGGFFGAPVELSDDLGARLNHDKGKGREVS